MVVISGDDAGWRGPLCAGDDPGACSDLGSRLFLRVREEMGLAYYVGAQHFPELRRGISRSMSARCRRK